MSRARARLALALAIALLAVGALFFVRPLAPPEIEPACAYRTPILCAELPPNGEWLGRVLAAPPNDPGAWRFATWLDMAFLVLYASVLAVGLRSMSRGRMIATIAILAVVLGALLDVSENIGILTAGASPSDTHASWIATSARTKFVLLDAGCAALFMLRAAESTSLAGRALFVVLALPCIAGLGGVFVPVLVELSIAGITLACLYVMCRAIASLASQRRGARERS